MAKPISTAPASTRTARSFQNANKMCGKKIGAPAWWITGTGPPGDVTVQQLAMGRQTVARPERSSGPAGPADRPGVRGGQPVAEFSARRVVAIAAVAGALVGGAVAGGVAVASTSGNDDSPASSSGSGGSVATAAVVRTTLTNTVQVGGSIGYDGSYTVAAPSGTSAQQVAQAQQAVTQDEQTLSADEQAESDASTRRRPGDRGRPGQRQQPTSPPSARTRPRRPGLRRDGGVHAGVQPGRPEGQPGPDPADPGQPAAGHRPVDRDP